MMADELVVIQTVSQSGKTMVIQKGKLDGVSLGQEAVFVTPKISIVLRATEVNRTYSLWQVADPDAVIPFNRKEIVIYTTSNEEALWAGNSYMMAKLKEAKTTRLRNYWLIRANYSYALSESVGDTQTKIESYRTGAQLEGLFSTQLNKKVDLSAGFRFDYETMTQKFPALSVPTQRLFVIAEATYNFEEWHKSSQNLYIGATIGAGISQTVIDEVKIGGTSSILPSVRFGLHTPIAYGKYSLLIELAVESISTREKHPDGFKQSTNIINTKLGLGLKF